MVRVVRRATPCWEHDYGVGGWRDVDPVPEAGRELYGLGV